MSMDYTYIEQLLERYFEAETSREEEHILREFFAQESVPAHLEQYAALFRAEAWLAEAHLDERFDERVLALVGEEHVSARRLSLRRRLRPMLHVAAMVAVVVAIGSTVERTTSEAATEVPAGAGVAASVAEDYAVAEPTPLDVRSAEAVETADSMGLLR